MFPELAPDSSTFTSARLTTCWNLACSDGPAAKGCRNRKTGDLLTGRASSNTWSTPSAFVMSHGAGRPRYETAWDSRRLTRPSSYVVRKSRLAGTVVV
jgi:hypothetical protein